MIKESTFRNFHIDIWALNVNVGWGRSSSHCWGWDLPWTGTGWWWGAKGAKFGKKGRFGKLVVKNKKGEEAEERERREGGFLPWTPISTIGALYDDYNGSYVLCERLMNVNNFSADCTSKTNKYIVLRRNSFCCCGFLYIAGYFKTSLHIPFWGLFLSKEFLSFLWSL